mmetsp:Transcript_21264/g.56830  ORF Transcript_21264/g.56830 Transcript_21264/m.56830 type:complete len:303 (-) Transcript_21264:229-1137(-)
MRHAPVLRGRRRIHLALVAQYERHLSRQFLPCVGAVVFGEHHRALHHLLPSPRAHHQHLPQPQQYFCHRLLTPRGVHHHRTPSLLAHHELRPRQRRGRRQLAFPKQREVRDPHPLLAEDGEGIRGRSDAGAGDDDRGLRAERDDGGALFSLVGHEMEHYLEIVVQLNQVHHPYTPLGIFRHLHRKRNHQLPMQHRQTILPKLHPSLRSPLPIKQHHLGPLQPHLSTSTTSFIPRPPSRTSDHRTSCRARSATVARKLRNQRGSETSRSTEPERTAPGAVVGEGRKMVASLPKGSEVVMVTRF